MAFSADGSRICDSSRVALAAIDANLTMTAKADKLIYAAGVLTTVRMRAGATVQGVTRVNSNVTLADANYSGVTMRVTGIVASSFNVGAIDAAALATDTGQEIADRVLLRNIDTGNDSGRSVAQALHILRNRVDATSSVLTVYQTDDATSSWTASLTTGVAVSITEVNPL